MRLPFLPLLSLTLLGCPAGSDTAPPAGETPRLGLDRQALALDAMVPEAVALAPAWLQDDLVVSLGQLDETLQNELATLLIDLDDPWLVDEVAFAIAHTSPEVLRYTWFFPELLVINAELIYAYDPDLDYVQLEDVGEPGVDADYHTTATYTVEVDGALVERTADPDIYYWYVVHPRLEDELPWFLDAWANDDPTSPDAGLFWREFLWDKAADECPDDGRACPLLQDYLTVADTVWKGKQETREDNGAIGEITQYIWDAIDFGAGSERPVQPSRIYTVGAGNCGEHADLSCAAARTGLIPCRNVGARSNDHTWDEFWDDRWVAFEPIGTHVDYFGYYGGPEADYYVYDGKDNDCDGVADLGESDADEDGDGWTVADGDCNDNKAEVNPDMPEVVNGYDDDCDGDADEDLDPFGIDYDGDGWTITDGDCNDLDFEVNPGVEESADLRDDDCDGQIDEGTDGEGDTNDWDGDGWSVADGDCDDNNPEVNPDAREDDNGYDDNCDGVAEEGETGPDYDDDGWSTVRGDCDDLDDTVEPRADDPHYRTGNRLYAMTSLRGDTLVDDTLTENYGVPSYLEFHVTDANGDPVDGASITIFGTWAVYGHGDSWTYASETVTDLDGYALATVGKHNPYGYAVYSSVEDAPGGGSLYQACDWIEAGDTLVFDVELTVPRPGTISPHVIVREEPVEADAVLDVRYDVQQHHIAGDGGFMTREYEFWWGSFMKRGEGGALDLFVLDGENLALFEAGEPFEVEVLGQDSQEGHLELALALDEPRYLVLYNPAVTAHMVGDLEASIAAPEGVRWSEEPAPVNTRFHIPPGGWTSLKLEP